MPKTLTIKKYFVKGINKIFVFSSSYGRNLEYINSLANEIKSDYPELSDKDIEMDTFLNSDRFDRIAYVHAHVEEPKEDYTVIESTSYFY